MANAKHWTHKEITTLTDGVGRNSFKWVQQKMGSSYEWPNAPKYRSKKSIYSQMYRQHGPGGFTRGIFTLSRAVSFTGYSKSQLVRARDALNQRWHRSSKTGVYLIEEEQIEKITEWLQSDFWSKSKKLYGCVWCSTSKIPMHAYGLCKRDYPKYQKQCDIIGIPIEPRNQAYIFNNVIIPELADILKRDIALPLPMLVKIASMTKLSDNCLKLTL